MALSAYENDLADSSVTALNQNKNEKRWVYGETASIMAGTFMFLVLLVVDVWPILSIRKVGEY